MKNILLTILVLICSLGFSQTTTKYSKAKITYNNPENYQKLVQLGIPIDHGQQKRGVFIISDFSQKEITKVREAGIQIDILIDDVAADFIERNKRAKHQKLAKDLTCPTYNGTIIEYPTPTNFALGSMGGYLTYQEMLDNLDAMRTKYPNLISARADVGTFVTNGASDNSVTPSIGGNALQWVRISDNPDSDESEPEILYDAIHHAREPASLSQLIYYMWYLLENYATNPDIKQIVDNTELYFVPVVNPDGYLYNQKTNPNGGGMWRKNRFNSHGVDNNRNYDYYPDGTSASSVWGGQGTSTDTSSDVYAGSGPFSEIENQAMKWFTEQHDFILAMNNHTFGDLLLYPYGYDNNKPTPENNIYEAISSEMVSQNGFNNMISSGLYPAAGDSDDFMYGGITQSHNRIFAFTPEIGSSFWPASNQIDGICKSMMYLNITAAKLTHNFAKITSSLSSFIGENLSYNANYTIKRLGLTGNGNFTVRIIPVSSNIASVGPAKNYTNLALGTLVEDHIMINLNNGINVGEEIIYTIEIDAGILKETINVTNRFGSLQNIVDNDANTLTDYTGTGWSTTTSTFVSSNASITESPNGDYGQNENKTIEYSNPIDLTQAGEANVQFYAKWDIENNWDYAQFEVSIDNGNSWIPQCSKHTNPGSTNAGQPTGEPLYDGTQSDWILEEISLNDYLGETIKIRFQFVSDGAEQKDGFYFDDLKINMINKDVLSSPEFIRQNFDIYPNPVEDILQIQTKINENYQILIYNIQGQKILKIDNFKGNQQIDLSKFTRGLYFITISAKENHSTLKVLKK